MKPIIDGCKHGFLKLSRSILPKHLNRLRKNLSVAVPAKYFIRPQIGPKRIAKMFNRHSDFSGCYVFLSGNKPIYVGISKKVIDRVRQHLRGRSHFEATLAYKIAERTIGSLKSRQANMNDGKFKKNFADAKLKLAKSRVAFVEINNPLERYLFEVYTAIKLKTGRWNSFDTH